MYCKEGSHVLLGVSEEQGLTELHHQPHKLIEYRMGILNLATACNSHVKN